MNGAIYARRSREQKVSEDAKSVTRQKENSQAFAARQGWTVDPAHVYEDDGISGAEFEKRPGFMQMMAAAERRGGSPFQVLIVSEQKSIGREMVEVPHIIKRLAMAGVEIYEYVHGRCLTPKTSTEKLLSVVQSYSDEDHRVKTAERMREAHVRLAKKGRVTGGRVFGYKNVDIFDGSVDEHGRPRRSHVEYGVNPEEAAVVRRAFELYASGEGFKAVAKILNREGAAAPRYTHHREGWTPVGRWSATTLRAVLGRELYRGVVIWGRVQKRVEYGGAVRRPEDQWVRTSREDLQIVSDELWNRVASRRGDVAGRAIRFDSGRLSGRPPKGEPVNLLAGLATCGCCGGGLAVTGGRKRDDAFDVSALPRPGQAMAPVGKRHYYVCARRVTGVPCGNTLRVLAEEVNSAVLDAIEEHALQPAAIEQVIQLSERDENTKEQERLAREAEDVDRKIKRLIQAIQAGGELVSVMDAVRQLEWRRKQIDEERKALKPIPRLEPKVVASRLEQWRALLRGSVTQGRAVLQRVIRGRITFTPRPDGRGLHLPGQHSIRQTLRRAGRTTARVDQAWGCSRHGTPDG